MFHRSFIIACYVVDDDVKKIYISMLLMDKKIISFEVIIIIKYSYVDGCKLVAVCGIMALELTLAVLRVSHDFAYIVF